MCGPKLPRWLPSMALLTALAMESLASFSQTPSTPAPSQTATPAPANQTLIAGPQLNPTPEEVGDALFAHQRYQAAIESYKKGPRDSADVWNKMGIANQMMYNLEEASHCYQESLRIDPRNTRVLNNLATIYDSQKEYGAAERLYRKALKLDPHSALIEKNLGTNLLAQHKYKKGWEIYKAALTLDPHIFDPNASPRVDNPASIQERGAMNYYMAKGCARAGMIDRAIEYLRIALNEGFTNPRQIEADNEFASLRGIPAYEQLLAAQTTQRTP